MRNKLKAVTKFERRAFLLGVVLLVGLATLGLTGLASADQIGPNPTVQLVDNPNVSCESPVPSAIDAGQLGDTLTVSTEDPIDFVLVKSAPNAEVTRSVRHHFHLGTDHVDEQHHQLRRVDLPDDHHIARVDETSRGCHPGCSRRRTDVSSRACRRNGRFSVNRPRAVVVGALDAPAAR